MQIALCASPGLFGPLIFNEINDSEFLNLQRGKKEKKRKRKRGMLSAEVRDLYSQACV